MKIEGVTIKQATISDDRREIVLRVMRRWRKEGAHYTSDIAHGAGFDTSLTRRILESLEKAGMVQRVVTGNPTSWELVDG